MSEHMQWALLVAVSVSSIGSMVTSALMVHYAWRSRRALERIRQANARRMW